MKGLSHDCTNERDILMEVKAGKVVENRIKENGKSKDKNAPEGYGVVAMSFLTGRNK